MNKPEEFDIDVSDFDEKPKRPDDIESGELEARHQELGRQYAADRAREDQGFRAVAEDFFSKNPFLVERFNKDPEAMQRFKLGLKSLVITSAVAYRCDPKELVGDPRFHKDLVKFSFEFEEKEEERKRKAGRRAA